MNSWAIFLLSLSVRLAYLLEIRSFPLFRYPIVDAHAYDSYARSILAGDGFGSGVFYQDPLYPYLLAVFQSLPGRPLPAAIFQAALDSLTVVLIYRLGRRLFSPAAGLAAGLAAALYAPAVFYAGLLEKTTVAQFLVMACLWALSAAGAGRGPRAPFFAGGLLGLGLLARGNLYVFIPAAAAWLAWRKRSVAPLLPFLAGLALAVSPATIRNSTAGKDLVLTTSQGGWNFYKGNCPEATGTLAEPLGVRNVPLHEERETRALAEREAGRTLKPSEVSRHWLGRGVSFIRERPGDWARLLLRKLSFLANAFEPPDSYDYYFFKERSAVLRLLPLGFGAALAFGLAGLAVTTGAGRLGRDNVLPLVLGGAYVLSLLLFYVTSRYRLPLAPVLLLYAAHGAVLAWEQASRRAYRLPVLWLAYAAAFGAFSLREIARPNLDRSRFAAAGELLRHGRHEEAASLYRAMLPANESCPALQFNLGLALLELGRAQDGARALRNAYWLRPDADSPHYAQMRAHAFRRLRELGVSDSGERPAGGPCALEGRRFGPP